MTAPEPPPGTPRRLDDPTWVDDIVASAAARVGGAASRSRPSARGNGAGPAGNGSEPEVSGSAAPGRVTAPAPHPPATPAANGDRPATGSSAAPTVARGNGDRPPAARRDGDPRGNGHRRSAGGVDDGQAPDEEAAGEVTTVEADVDPDEEHRDAIGARADEGLHDRERDAGERGPGDRPAVVVDARRPKGSFRSAVEWAVVVVGSVLVALLLKTFVFQAFLIPSASMAATLEEGDRVLVNRLSYELGDLERGDVVVFERPDDASVATEASGSDDLIKRIVGLPGDSVAIEDSAVVVNGIPLDEPYVADGAEYPDMAATLVPAEHVFVLGDNRSESRDSRSFGPIPVDDIVGRAMLRIWPPSRLGTL